MVTVEAPRCENGFKALYGGACLAVVAAKRNTGSTGDESKYNLVDVGQTT
jgi:hypothetical protein